MARSFSIVLVVFAVAVAVAAISFVGGRRAAAGESMLAVGASTPELVGVDQAGATHRLSETRGHPTVVYFYPMDETPGCTKEACAFRDVWSQYEKANVRIFGVSRDDKESHEKFATKYKLPFPLIADTDGTWAAAFGVPRMFGRYSRVSFLLGSDGKVLKVYPNVDPGVHAASVLADAEAQK